MQINDINSITVTRIFNNIIDIKLMMASTYYSHS